ncbi:MAG: hypothetical protein IKV28_05400 [Bacteroidales bacterium]|nr:hypothetical protein [Bacteroidales bacterium]
MEGISLSGKGLMCIGPSESANVRGGTGADLVHGVIAIIITVLSNISQYMDDLIKGFNRGWNSIKMAWS